MNCERFRITINFNGLRRRAVIATLLVDEELGSAVTNNKEVGRGTEAQNLLLALQLKRGHRLVLVVSDEVNS